MHSHLHPFLHWSHADRIIVIVSSVCVLDSVEDEILGNGEKMTQKNRNLQCFLLGNSSDIYAYALQYSNLLEICITLQLALQIIVWLITVAE